MDQLPPYDLEAEESVLGSCLLNRDAIILAAPILTEHSFYLAKNGAVFRAILSCYQKRIPPDIRTVADALRADKQLELIGGREYLSDLVDAPVTSYHVEHYARIVARHAAARNTIRAGEQIAALGWNDELGSDDLRAQSLSILTTAAPAHTRGGFKVFGDLLQTQWDRAQEGEPTGIALGYPDLDRLICGLAPGNLMLVAGVTGSGKSAFAMNVAWQFARRGETVGIVSLEMTADEYTQRVVAQETGIPTTRQREVNLSDEELPRYIQMMSEHSKAPLFIEDTTSITPSALRVKALQLHAQHDLKLLVVDYLGLLSMDLRRMNTAQAMQQAAQEIKNLAAELHCPVLLLTQLNREIYKRPKQRPQLSDIREAGEAPATQILVIHREIVINPDSDRPNEADLYLLKNRNGPTGRVVLGYDGARTMFYNLERYRNEELYDDTDDGYEDFNNP